MRGRKKFAKAKGVIRILVFILSLLPRRIRKWLLNRSRMMQGVKGLAIRYCLLKTLAIECGENVSIHPAVYLLGVNNFSIGNNVSIHPFCYLDATGGIEIGNDVSIAHGTTIMSTTHTFADENIPIKDQKIELQKVIIEDNVWIGAKATILSGNRIENGSIVAAAAVVTKDVKKNSIVAGVPAKPIKQRG